MFSQYMLLCLQTSEEIEFDTSSHRIEPYFLKIFKESLRILKWQFSSHRYVFERADCLQTQTHHILFHDNTAGIEFYCLWYVCQCSFVSFWLGIIENLLRFVLSVKFILTYWRHRLNSHPSTRNEGAVFFTSSAIITLSR